MPIEATIFNTRSLEGQELGQMIIDYLKQIGISAYLNDKPTQTEFFKACISQDLVIVDATVESNNLHNYEAFTAQPYVLDHVLVVSRTYLPHNFYGLREGGAPAYPNTMTNKEIFKWLLTELTEIMPLLPRASWKKNILITGVISPLQDLNKEIKRESKRHQIFISYRNQKYEEVLKLKNKLEQGEFHNGEKQGVRLFYPGELAYQDEILSPIQRWGILSIIEEKMRAVKECWVYESIDDRNKYLDYYNSWWTCGEIIILAYFNAISKTRPTLKVYNPHSNELTVEPVGLIPLLTYEERRNMDKLLSGSGRSQGAETAKKMRELAQLPIFENLVFFNHKVFSEEWFTLRVFEEYGSEESSWKNNIDIYKFIQMIKPQLIPIPDSILEQTTRNGTSIYEYKFDNKKSVYEIIMMDKPRFVWYATRMGQKNGIGEEFTIVKQPVFRAINLSK